MSNNNQQLRPYNAETIDLNMDSMNEFMKQLVDQVNRQEDQIHQLQRQIKSKSNNDDIGQKFKQISQALEFNESELRKKMELKQGSKQEIDGDIVNESVNKICERLQLISKGWEYSLDLNKSYLQQLNKIEQQLHTKVDKVYVKKKTRKARKIAHTELDEANRLMVQRINQFQIDQKKENIRVEQLVKESEKKTYWKIHDCESLLQKRVNEDYIENIISNLDKRIKKEMNEMLNNSFKNVNDKIESNKGRVLELAENVDEKIKVLKRMIGEQEQDNRKMYVEQRVYEEQRNIQNVDIQEVMSNILKIEKRGDYREGQARLLEMIRKLEGGQEDQQNGLKRLKLNLEEFASSMARSSSGKQGEGSSVDIHKICVIECEIKMLRDELNEQKYQMKRLDTDMEIKQQQVTDKVNQQVQKMNNKEDEKNKLKEQFIDILEKNNQKILGEISTLKQKMSDVQDNNQSFELEKKMTKLESKINVDEILSLLSEKITQKDLNVGMTAVDQDIQQIQQILQTQQSQLGALNQFMFDFQQALDDANQREEMVATFLKSNKITKLRCSTCGIQNSNFYNKDNMKAKQGQYNRADLNGIKLKEGREVYDLTINQVNKLFKADCETKLNASHVNDSIYKR